MTLQSDLTIDASKLEPEAMTESTRKLNASLMSMLDGAPRWWEVYSALVARTDFSC